MTKQLVPPSARPALPDPQALLPLYQEWLPLQVIRQLFKETGHRFYQRILPPLLVLWGFIFQRLNPDHTCDACWSYLSSDAVRERLGLPPLAVEKLSESNSAYCQARKRLPWAVVQGILSATARAFQQAFGDSGLWHGARVNLFDGSTLRLPASPELTGHYGGASNQHGQSHWPLLRVVAGFDLFSGVANAVAEGPYRIGEHALAADVIRQLGAGYVHVGDRNFGIYHLVQVMDAVHSHALLRLKITQAQHLAGQPLRSGLDLDVVWSPSRFDTCEADLPTPPIAGRLIYVRLERDGFRPIDLYLFTTLLERTVFAVSAVVALYGERWNVELDLRHVKTTLQMEQLAGHSVDIVRKELVLGLTAYNLLRGLMGVAAIQAHRLPLELSLAQCWRRMLDASRSLGPETSTADVERVMDRLLRRLGRCVLPKRKRERFEPRAIWGRPQVYPKIKGSREEARQTWLKLLKNQKS
jgi:hypothetical protein